MNRMMAERLRAGLVGGTLLVLVLAAGAASAAAAERVVGWRTDTTGCYPDATPPLHWGPNQNVAFCHPLPGKSAATPILVGEKVLVMSDPYWLICLNKGDGKVLWQADNAVEQAAPKEDVEAYESRLKARQDLALKLGEARRAALAADEQAKAAPDKPDAKARAAELARQVLDLEKQHQALPTGKAIKPNGTVSLSCCTPVSDGTVVVALYNSGVLACYGLDGQRRWARLLRKVEKGYGQSMSPALSGGVVGVHLDDTMFGVDLKTGKTLWQDYELQHQGSPVGFRVGTADIFLTCEGHVRRAQDGKVLVKAGGAMCLFSTPALHGDTAYLIAENRRLTVCQFLPKEGDGVQAKGGGVGGFPRGVYYASVLVQDGLVYVWNNAPSAPKDDAKQKMPRTLHVLDQKTGKLVKDLPQPAVGWAYPSPTGAGGFVYVAGNSGSCTVYWPGKDRSFKEVAVNKLEPFDACPVFEKDRLYVRTAKNLYCLRVSPEDLKLAQTLREGAGGKGGP